ncbi:MAG: hypothetical protein U0531_18860 [Dehalococcoidia bacterium]
MGINRVLLASGQLLFVALIFGLPLFASGAGAHSPWVAGWLYLALFMGFVVALTLALPVPTRRCCAWSACAAKARDNRRGTGRSSR